MSHLNKSKNIDGAKKASIDPPQGVPAEESLCRETIIRRRRRLRSLSSSESRTGISFQEIKLPEAPVNPGAPSTSRIKQSGSGGGLAGSIGKSKSYIDLSRNQQPTDFVQRNIANAGARPQKSKPLQSSAKGTCESISKRTDAKPKEAVARTRVTSAKPKDDGASKVKGADVKAKENTGTKPKETCAPAKPITGTKAKETCAQAKEITGKKQFHKNMSHLAKPGANTASSPQAISRPVTAKATSDKCHQDLPQSCANVPELETLYFRKEYRRLIERIAVLDINNQSDPRWLAVTALYGLALFNQHKHADAIDKLAQVWAKMKDCETIEKFAHVVLPLAQCYAKLNKAAKTMELVSNYIHLLAHFGLEIERHECYKLEAWAKPINARYHVSRGLKNHAVAIRHNKCHLSSEDLQEFILKFRCDLCGAMLGSMRQVELYGRISPSKCNTVWNDWIHAAEKPDSSSEKAIFLKMRQVYELLQRNETTAIDIISRLEPIIKNLPENNDLVKISFTVFQATLEMAIGNLDNAKTVLNTAFAKISMDLGNKEIALHTALGIKVRLLLISVFEGNVENGVKSLLSLCELFPYCGDSVSWFTRLTLCYKVDKDVIENLGRFTAPNIFNSEIHQLAVSVYYAKLYKVTGELAQNDNSNLLNIATTESCLTAEELLWLIKAQYSIRNGNIAATERSKKLMIQLIRGGTQYIDLATDFALRIRHSDASESVSSTLDFAPTTDPAIYKAISIQLSINSIRNLLYRGELEKAEQQLKKLRMDVLYWPLLLVQEYCGTIVDLEDELLSHQIQSDYPAYLDM